MNRRLLASAVLALAVTVVVASTPAQARSAERQGAISAHLMLPSKSIVAGSTVQIELQVSNRGAKAVPVSACPSPFAVALSRKNYDPDVVWNLCATPFTIPVGDSTYELPLQASYWHCGGEGLAGSPPQVPCVNGQAPPLPVGRYQVKLYQQPSVVNAPTPISVRVVTAAS